VVNNDYYLVLFLTVAGLSLECSGGVAKCRDVTSVVNAYMSSPSFDVTALSRDVCLTIGYKPMTVEVFSQLRQSLGQSECEHCGRLFLLQSDLDAHWNDDHTCMSSLFLLSLSS